MMNLQAHMILKGGSFLCGILKGNIQAKKSCSIKNSFFFSFILIKNNQGSAADGCLDSHPILFAELAK